MTRIMMEKNPSLQFIRDADVVEGKFTRLGQKLPKFERPASVEEMLKELQSDLKYGLPALIAVVADQTTQV
nr:hypothetical protein [Tanacetum cinerariifolium]